MKVDNDTRTLARFYCQLAVMIRKSKTGSVTLAEAETLTKRHRDMVFSWLQWNDAKRWFMTGTCSEGICYCLRREYRDIPTSEIAKEINTHYKLYNYD